MYDFLNIKYSFLFSFISGESWGSAPTQEYGKIRRRIYKSPFSEFCGSAEFLRRREQRALLSAKTNLSSRKSPQAANPKDKCHYGDPIKLYCFKMARPSGETTPHLSLGFSSTSTSGCPSSKPRWKPWCFLCGGARRKHSAAISVDTSSTAPDPPL